MDASPDLTETLIQRNARYGDFADQARIAQALKDLMWVEFGWQRLSPDKKEALQMIQHKISRILNGDPEYRDSWHDIAGYAQLVADRLT